MANFNEYLQSCLDYLHNQKFYKEANEFKKAILDTYFRKTIEEVYNTDFSDAD